MNGDIYENSSIHELHNDIYSYNQLTPTSTGTYQASEMLDLNRVVETAAGGSIATIVKKLASLSLDQLSKLREVSSNIESLKVELQIIHAVLLDLSNEEQPDRQLKLWMNKVRELAYDIEDAIDKFKLASENKNARSVQESQDPNFTDGVIATIRSCANRIKSLPSDYRIAKEIQCLKDRVTTTEERRKRMKTGENSNCSSCDAIAIRDVAPYADPTDLVGLEVPTENIVCTLAEERSSLARRRKMVAIVGFGGLGKTTLAKQVFDRISGEYHCTAFVPVTRNADMNKVLRDILLDFESSYTPKELQQLDQRQLTNNIRKYIQGKRYLVVLDDIWSKDAWRILKGALFDNNSGSTIIVTTRKNEVAEECCSSTIAHVYKMEPLDKDNSQQLFTERAFGHKGCPPNLKHVCGKILKKCGGSPLAILTLSGLFINKVKPSQWEEVLSSLDYAVSEDSDVDAMRRILSFSYFDLPQHLKTCLLYFSIFPEDSVIKRKRLVNRWIAEGFIDTDDGRSKTQIGDNYFNELISRNLIQPVDIQYDGQARACQVHDTILDFIVSKSVEENFITFLGAQERRPDHKVRYLSIQNIEYATQLGEQDVSHIRSLTMFGETEHMPCSFSLSGFTSLRVLDLKESDILASVSMYQDHVIAADVARLFHLKYLDITGLYRNCLCAYFSKLLKEIANLQYLETLDIRGTPPSELPADAYKLQRLVRLFIDDIVTLPDGIGELKALEELKVIDINSPSLEFLQELGQLSKLRLIGIYIEKGQTNLERESVLISSLYKLGMCNLHSLTIDVSDESEVMNPFCLDDSNGHSWQAALQSLRKFRIKWGYICKVPDWMGSLKFLEKLHLAIFQTGQEDLNILGDLHSLLYLFLEFLRYPKGRLTFRGSNGFQCLKYLGKQCCPKGMMLTFEDKSMPRLEHLQFELYTHYSTISLFGGFNFGIEHLHSLKRIDVRIYYNELREDGLEHAAETAIRNAVSKLSNNPKLGIQRVPATLGDSSH